jgi:hypothetical protein
MLVSSLLCRVVTVQLSSRSLRNAEMLLSNPIIARGAQALKINLRYRASGIAANIDHFHVKASKIVLEARAECEWHTEFASFDNKDDTEEAVKYRAYLRADEIFRRYSRAWLALKQRQRGESWNALSEEMSTVSADQEFFTDAFTAYTDGYHDQRRIVHDGTFVQGLVGLIRKLHIAPFIWFTDADPFEYQDRYHALNMISDLDKFCRYLRAPHGWMELEQDAKGVEVDLLPARILAELPIACHAAGAPIYGLSIGCFPHKRHFSQLISDCTDDDAAPYDWKAFATACQDLHEFHFGMSGMNYTPLRPAGIEPAQQHIIDNYIGGASSGPKLERFCINMGTFKVHDGRGQPQKGADCCDTEKILTRLVSIRLLELQMLHV